MDVNERNFKALEQAFNTLNRDHMTLSELMLRLENNMTVMQSELANQKALTAHVLGRGMGSTVHRD